MSDDEVDTIALAIKSLETSTSKLLKRRDHSVNEKSRRRIRRLVDHARHIFAELFKKRRSLKAFLLWFRKEWIRIEVELEKYPVEILQHSMQHFLRCQDAFILLTSGECRHEHDTKLAKITEYRSRLSTLQERDDGYTILYKGTGIYSGYGFDEFNNEVVGIRALLVKELKRYHKSPWDYLERHGGVELLESLLDKHEREAKELQHSLQSLKRRMIEDINKRLTPKSLKFATQDKMERLCLSVQGRRIDLERRAGSFQIEGPLLPDKNVKAEDWNYCSLNLKNEKNDAVPLVKKQKRRRVIVDSESEDEMIESPDKNEAKSSNQLAQTAGKSSGLVVRVDSSLTNSEKEDSLAVIKNQLGVNTHDLEQAREILEGEDANKKRIFEQEKVDRLEKVLNRVLSRDEIDENEVWDARECLRYACMEAGNKYLWDSRVGCVAKAIDNFEKAKKIVEMQQRSQQQLADTESALLIQINLLYLHAQASVNIGISLVDGCHRKISTSKANILHAIKEFEATLSLMLKLRGLAEKAIESSSNTMELTSYILKSNHIESLACRWMGRGFWLASQEKKAIAAFEQASEALNDTNLQKWQSNAYVEGDAFEVAAEAIYATCDLADRCCLRIEEFENQSRISRKKGDEILDIVTLALTRHIEISESIERYFGPLRAKHFCVEYDISSIEDVRLYRQEIINRWKDLVNKQADSALPTKSHHHLTVKRSDISAATNVVLVSGKAPTYPIFSTDGRKRRRYPTQRNGSYGTNAPRGNKSYSSSKRKDAVHALSSKGLHNRPSPPIEFRKWGDEILIAEQQKTKEGKSGGQPKESCSSSLVLAYPSIAPPMPLDYQ